MKLTARQIQIVKRVADAKLHKEIGDELGISEKTVADHIGKAVLKLGLRPVSGPSHCAVLLTRWAIREGLVRA